MKISLASTILLGFASTLAKGESPPESGANCKVQATVECRLLDGTDRECKSLEFSPYTECGLIKLEWKYTWCNRNTDDEVQVKDKLFEPLLHNVNIVNYEIGFDRSRMGKEECRERFVQKTVNSCEKRNTVASLKFEGKLAGDRVYDLEDYCYDFAFSKQKIGQAPLPLTQPPQAPITLEPDGTPNVDVNLSCKVIATGQNCNTISQMIPRSANDCRVPVEYSYIVSHSKICPFSLSGNGECNGVDKARLLALVENEENILLGRNTPILTNFERHFETFTDIINICKRQGEKITKTVIAVMGSANQGNPGTGVARLDISIPVFSTTEWRLIDVQCFYNGLSCSNFQPQQCGNYEFDFTYKLRNEGFACNTITAVSLSVDGTSPRFTDIGSCSNRDICSGNNLVVRETRSVNTCVQQTSYKLTFYLSTITQQTITEGTWQRQIAITGPTPPVPAPFPAPVLPYTRAPVRTPTASVVPKPVPYLPICTTVATELTIKLHSGHSCLRDQKRRNLRKTKSEKGQSSSYTTVISSGNGGSSSSHTTGGSSSHSSTTTKGGSSSTTTTTTTTQTIISQWSTSYCSCNDYATLTPYDIVNIEMESKNGKQNYGLKPNSGDGSTFVVSAGGNIPLKNNITIKIFSQNGRIAQTLDINTGGHCLENLVNTPMGSLEIVGFR